MPKKTRREKALARARRSRTTIPPAPTPSLENERDQETDSRPFAYSIPSAATHEPAIAKTQADDTDYAVIRRDILRTVIWAVVFIGLELTVYYAYQHNLIAV